MRALCGLVECRDAVRALSIDHGASLRFWYDGEPVHQREQLGEELVTPPLKLGDGAAARLAQAALHHPLTQVRRQRRRLQPGPRLEQGGAEMIKHVRHSRAAAGEVEGEAGS